MNANYDAFSGFYKDANGRSPSLFIYERFINSSEAQQQREINFLLTGEEETNVERVARESLFSAKLTALGLNPAKYAHLAN